MTSENLEEYSDLAELASEDEPKESAEDAQVASKKIEVIGDLIDRLWPDGATRPLEPLIVTSADLKEAINQRNARYPGEKKPLSPNNVANFLKDFIRKTSCNSNWPQKLKSRRITARQRYGQGRVFEFVDYRPGDTEPFPNRFDPVPEMTVLPFEALSIPREARALGRTDEPWLIQVIVNQRLVFYHLAVVARPRGLMCESLVHLQMSVKTQPEIDATFLAEILVDNDDAEPRRIRAYITGEAKQSNERILEDQLREQVAQAFSLTEELKGDEAVDAVMPMVFQAVSYPSGPSNKGIYIVQFHLIMRDHFNDNFSGENLHEMPLVVQSRAFFTPHPPIQGISYKAPPKRRRGSKGAAKRRKSTEGK